MADEKSRPIIIKRKAGGHGGHHGGAWKVAYADFVTAMMALFIVLWLMNSNSKVQEAVAGYFRDPAGVGKLAGTQKEHSGKSIEVSKDNMKKVKEDLEKALQTLPKFQTMKNQIAITVTNEGLRVELLETEKGMFFESGSSVPTDNGVELLQRLAEELGKLPNRLLIEGHTDSRPFVGNGIYSNWELSSDRANQARQLMQSNGLHTGQVFQVRGFADQELRDPGNPAAPSNRRISVIVQYQGQKPKSEAAKAEGVKPEGEKSGAVKSGTVKSEAVKSEAGGPAEPAGTKPAENKPKLRAASAG